MEMTILAQQVPWWSQALAILFILVCLFLIILVLLQKGRGAGLSAAFGGAGGQSAFGTKTGDVFTWATIVVVGVFLLLSMVLTVVYKPYETDAPDQAVLTAPGEAPAPEAGDDAAPADQDAPDAATDQTATPPGDEAQE